MCQKNCNLKLKDVYDCAVENLYGKIELLRSVSSLRMNIQIRFWWRYHIYEKWNDAKLMGLAYLYWESSIQSCQS